MKLGDETIGAEETFELVPAGEQEETWGNTAGQSGVWYRNLLVPLDYSECAKHALEAAVAIARDFGSKLRLVHVLEPSGFFTGEQPALQRPRPKILQNLKSNLAAYAYENIDEDIPLDYASAMGRSYTEICRVAKEKKSDLIVISTHGRGGLAHTMLGSTAERVVRQAPCSVLVVRGDENNPKKFRPKNILVPVDFSATSEKSFLQAVALAKQVGSCVTLLFVMQQHFSLPEYDFYNYAKIEEDIKAFGESRIAAARAKVKAARVNCLGKVCAGRPATEICAAVKELGCDLVVMSTHGRTGLKHALLGSTTEEVVRHASCPVLVVR